MLLVSLLGNSRATRIILLLCFFLLVSTSGIVFASSIHWVEVSRFTGSDAIQTEEFICDHVEWRIRWNYSTEFHMHSPTSGLFAINVFEKDPKRHVTSFIGEPTIGRENGTLSFSENGIFYLQINALNIEEYSVIVEQNINSIQEFPSWAILPLFLSATIAVVELRKRLKNQR